MALSSLSVVANADRLRAFIPLPPSIPNTLRVPPINPVVDVGRDQEEEYDMSEKSPKVTDPVCGMTVDPAKAAASVEHEGQMYYFCSKHCAATFTAKPEGYVSAAVS